MNEIRKVPCSTCGAAIGEPCKRIYADGSIQTYKAYYHRTRVVDSGVPTAGSR